MKLDLQDIQRLRDVFGQRLAKKLFGIPDPPPDPEPESAPTEAEATDTDTAPPTSESSETQNTDAGGEPQHTDPADPPQGNTAETDWQLEPLASSELSGAVLHELHEEGLTTFGDVADYVDGGKDLTAIKGIGPKRAEEILTALAAKRG